MNSKASINSPLLSADTLSTNPISSGIMICHPILEPGEYEGVVINGDRETRSFQLICNDQYTDSQVDIDLYKSDVNLEKDCLCSDKSTYNLRPGGYLVYYASFGDGKYRVNLSLRNKDNKGENYSTTNLQKGDLVVAMLMRPGEFEMRGKKDQKCQIYVEQLKNEEEYKKYSDKPVSIKIDDAGFSQKELKLMQGQALVINFETEGELNFKLVRPADTSDNPEKRHRWENPKYKYERK